MLFLKIVAGCLVALCLTAGTVFLLLRHWIKTACIDDSEPLSPLRIHLNRDLNPEWLQSPDAQEHLVRFDALNFRQGNAYTVPEMGNVRLCSLFSADHVAVLYQVEELGFVIDVVHIDTSGHETTYTNAPGWTDLDLSPPNRTKIHLPDADLQELVQELSDATDSSRSVVWTDDTFRQGFESSFRDEVLFKNRNGGIQLDWFRIIARKTNPSLPEEKIVEAFLEQKAYELDQWQDAAIDEHYERQRGDVESFSDGETLLLVPDRTDARAFVHHVSHYGLITADVAESLITSVTDREDIAELFTQINESLSPDLRAERVSLVEFPTQGALYRFAHL